MFPQTCYLMGENHQQIINYPIKLHKLSGILRYQGVSTIPCGSFKKVVFGSDNCKSFKYFSSKFRTYVMNCAYFKH